MRLKDLILNVENLGETELSGVTCDSRAVKSGFVFVCIKGALSDGHNFATKAIENGASVVIAEHDLGLENQIIVEDSHAAYSEICANWFGRPADKLKLIGVTGTNGKTSVTYMIKKILEASGEKVGLIGTNGNMIGDKLKMLLNPATGNE